MRWFVDRELKHLVVVVVGELVNLFPPLPSIGIDLQLLFFGCWFLPDVRVDLSCFPRLLSWVLAPPVLLPVLAFLFATDAAGLDEVAAGIPRPTNEVSGRMISTYFFGGLGRGPSPCFFRSRFSCRLAFSLAV